MWECERWWYWIPLQLSISHTHTHTHTHTNTERLGLCILGGRKCEMSCILETGTNLIPSWALLQSQRSHNNATAIPSPGFQNKCVYRSSASHGSGEVPKTAMTTAAMTHKHSNRKAANTKADREKLYRKTINRPIGVSRAEKQYPFIYLHLSAMKPRQRNQDNLRI